jgi:hypothetical protein
VPRACATSYAAGSPVSNRPPGRCWRWPQSSVATRGGGARGGERPAARRVHRRGRAGADVSDPGAGGRLSRPPPVRARPGPRCGARRGVAAQGRPAARPGGRRRRVRLRRCRRRRRGGGLAPVARRRRGGPDPCRQALERAADVALRRTAYEAADDCYSRAWTCGAARGGRRARRRRQSCCPRAARLAAPRLEGVQRRLRDGPAGAGRGPGDPVRARRPHLGCCSRRGAPRRPRRACCPPVGRAHPRQRGRQRRTRGAADRRDVWAITAAAPSAG